jgi:hypothetical protein
VVATLKKSLPARRLAIAGAVLMSLVGIIAVTRMMQSNVPPVCAGAAEKLNGVWDPATKEALHRALVASGYPSADDVWQHVESMVDGYSNRWKAMHREECLATRVRGEQSEDILTLRMVCLDRRRVDLSAAVNFLSKATREHVAGATKTVAELPSLARCADIEALKAPIPLPADPLRRADIDALYARLAAARTTGVAESLEQVAVDAEKLQWPPLAAEANLSACVALSATAERSLPMCKRAVIAALGAGDDATYTQALAQTVLVQANAHLEVDPALLEMADAVAARLTNVQIRAQVLSAHSAAAAASGRPEESIALQDRALAMLEAGAVVDPVELLKMIENAAIARAVARNSLGDDGRKLAQRAVALAREKFGPPSTRCATSLELQAFDAAVSGRPEDALSPPWRKELRLSRRPTA